jgi:type IV pilus assembly protein PilC
MSSHAIAHKTLAHAGPPDARHVRRAKGQTRKDPFAEVKSRTTPSARKIVLTALAPFTRGLSAMLDAGLPLDHALEAMQEQVALRPFRSVLRHIRASVMYGNRLSAAMALYPAVFDKVYISMLKSGETSGRMAETLEHIAEHLEASADLRHKVQSAMMYPIAVASIAVLLTTAIMIWIIPAFERIYADFGGTLPMATRVLIAISTLIRQNILLSIAGVTVVVIVLRSIRKTRPGRYASDRWLLGIPIFGALMQKVALARFTESISQMLRNGVPILQAIDLAEDVIDNAVLGRDMHRARIAVEQGSTFSAALKQSRWYPPLLLQMLATGEKTGRMDEMLERVSRFYRNEVTVTVNGLTSLIEPLLIVFLGVVIGGMVLCMFIPIFRLTEIVRF